MLALFSRELFRGSSGSLILEPFSSALPSGGRSFFRFYAPAFCAPLFSDPGESATHRESSLAWIARPATLTCGDIATFRPLSPAPIAQQHCPPGSPHQVGLTFLSARKSKLHTDGNVCSPPPLLRELPRSHTGPASFSRKVSASETTNSRPPASSQGPAAFVGVAKTGQSCPTSHRTSFRMSW